MFHSILDLLQKTSFWAIFDSSYDIILETVPNWKEHEQERWETRRRRAGEITFVYQNNKRKESITLARNNRYIYLENRWKRLHVFGKSGFLELEPSTMIYADSVSFLTSSDDRIQKYSSMFGFPWTNPHVFPCSTVSLKELFKIYTWLQNAKVWKSNTSSTFVYLYRINWHFF